MPKVHAMSPGGRSRVLRLPLTSRGRNFVVGDIHGAYDLVWEAMKDVGFDPARDKLLCCGDLIDRGAGSARARRFLRQPYVISVAGNHDRALVDLAKDGTLDDRAMVDALARMNYNGMRWMADVSLEDLKELAAALDELPFVIELVTERGLVGIVHADVPPGMDWQRFTAAIEAGDEYATRMALGMDFTQDHESRQRVQSRRMDGVPGVGRLFVGHTPQFDGLLKLANVWAIDSGACFGEAGKGKGHLTIVDPLMSTTYLTAPRERANPLLDVCTGGDIPDAPFSALESVTAPGM